MNRIRCAGCGGEKPPEAYPKRSGRQGRRGICRACLRARKRNKAADASTQYSGEAAIGPERSSGWHPMAQPADVLTSSRRNDSGSPSGELSALPLSQALNGAAQEAAAASEPDAGADEDSADKPRKRKRNRKRRGKAKKAHALAEAAANGAEAANSGDGTPMPEPEPSSEASGGEPHEGADEELPRKRKRKRRRKAKKNERQAEEQSRQEREAIDTDPLGAGYTGDMTGITDSSATYNAEELAGFEALDEPPAADIGGGPHGDDKTKRKRKRKRKSRKKRHKLQTSGAYADGTEPEEGGFIAEGETGGMLSEGGADGMLPTHAGTVKKSQLSPAGVEAGTANIAGEEQEQGLEQPAKRKRKRKRRRRKGKREASGLEAKTEPRPAVRPPNKRIVPFKGPFTFDSTILNDKGTGMIRLRGRRETGKRWHTEIEKDIAVRMVMEGAAGIVHPRLIHKLYTKSDLRLLILQRDDYVCRYCGKFGDTIDHVMPKSKGGLTSPLNCVCACSECNLLKADKLDFPFPDDWDEDE